MKRHSTLIFSSVFGQRAAPKANGVAAARRPAAEAVATATDEPDAIVQGSLFAPTS